MGDEENPDQQPYLSLDEIKRILLELQASNKAAESASAPRSMQVVKVDADAEDLLFIGEPGWGHNCKIMRCGLNEHILVRACLGNLSVTRRAKRLLRNFLKSQNQM